MMENYSCGIPGTAGGRFVQSASSLHYLSRSGSVPEHSDRTGTDLIFWRVRGFLKNVSNAGFSR